MEMFVIMMCVKFYDYLKFLIIYINMIEICFTINVENMSKY